MCITTLVLGDLCDNIGLVGVSAKWSYVNASPSHHDQAIPILSPLLFMHVGHPYIPPFKEFLIYLLKFAIYHVLYQLMSTWCICTYTTLSVCLVEK